MDDHFEDNIPANDGSYKVCKFAYVTSRSRRRFGYRNKPQIINSFNFYFFEYFPPLCSFEYCAQILWTCESLNGPLKIVK